MIVAVDFYRHNNEHVPVNASLLLMFMQNFYDEKFSFYAEASHAENVAAYMAQQQTNKTIEVIKTKVFSASTNDGKLFLLNRIFYETRQLYKLSKKIKNKNIRCLLLLSLSPINSVLAKKFLFRNKRTIIALHGDLEFIKLNNQGLRNFLGKCFLKSFKIKNPLNTYLVLGNEVKQNLIKYGALNEQEVVSVFHPYIYKKNIQATNYNYPLVFVHIGIASMLKQSFLFFKLAEAAGEDVKNNKAIFKLIGKNEDIPASEINEFVINAGSHSMLSRSEYETGIQSAHYAVFFHSNDNYEFTVSGSVLDAIDFEKPLIALKNDLFEAIFKSAGNIGFLCADYNEMLNVINLIIQNKNEEVYKMMQQNMKQFKAAHSIVKLRQQLFAQQQLAGI